MKKQYCIRLDEKVVEELNKISYLENRTRNNLIELIIEVFIKNYFIDKNKLNN